jgi:hypothetical protein
VEIRNNLVHAGRLTGSDPDAAIGAALEALHAVFEAFSWGSWRMAPTAPEPLRALAERMVSPWLPRVGG